MVNVKILLISFLLVGLLFASYYLTDMTVENDLDSVNRNIKSTCESLCYSYDSSYFEIKGDLSNPICECYSNYTKDLLLHSQEISYP